MATKSFQGGGSHVLDASAILALFLKEPGSELVQRAGPNGVVSAVNVSEVISKLLDRGSGLDTILAELDSLAFLVAHFDEARARAAGALRDRTRTQNISVADRACLALAIETSLPIYTTDRAWSELGLGLDIRQLR